MIDAALLLDIKKHGFSLKETNGRIQYYTKQAGEDTVLVDIIGNMVTVQSEYKGVTIMIANRYKVYNQEQFDFLLSNSGRI